MDFLNCPSFSSLPRFVIAKGNGKEWTYAGLGNRMNSLKVDNDVCICAWSQLSLEFSTAAKTLKKFLEVGKVDFAVSVLTFLSDSLSFYLLGYGNIEWLLGFTHVLLFSCREVVLSPLQGSFLCVWKNKKQK